MKERLAIRWLLALFGTMGLVCFYRARSYGKKIDLSKLPHPSSLIVKTNVNGKSVSVFEESTTLAKRAEILATNIAFSFKFC